MPDDIDDNDVPSFAKNHPRSDNETPPDLFDDDTPLACGLESPEECEACQ